MKVIEIGANLPKGVVTKGGRAWKLSESAKRDIEAIEQNHRRAMATAHLYWFD